MSFDKSVLIVPGAAVVGRVTLGSHVSVWYNAVLRGDEGPIDVGENTNIQDCAVLHAKTVVGRGCTIGHSAIVHGCTVGDNTLIGMGAILLDGARIGDNCVIGAGSLVTGKTVVPDGFLAYGNPAKAVRPLTEKEIQGNRRYMQAYLDAEAAYLRDRGNE